MNGAANQEVQKSRSRMKLYFILAYLFLIVMALLSSLGEAFIYIFTGLSLFFAFLGFQNRTIALQNDPYNRYRNEGRKANVSLDEWLRSLLNRSFQGRTSSPPSTDAKKIIGIVATVIAAVFTFIVAAIILTGNSGEGENALQVYKQLGDDYYNQGNFDSAYLNYRKGIVIDPGFADGYYGLANVKVQKKEFDSALYYYSQVLNVNPDFYAAAYDKAWIYYDQQNYEASMDALRYIFDRTDSYPDAYLLAGDNYYVRNQYDSAIAYYEPAYELGARSKELLNVMAYIYDQKGNSKQAIIFYKETLQYDSTIVDVYKRLGELIPGEEGNYFRMKAVGQ